GFLTVADVRRVRDQPIRPAGLVEHHLAGHVHPHRRTVPPDVTLLDVPAIGLAAEHPVDRRAIRFALVRMRDLVEREPADLLLRVARDLAEAVIRAQKTARHRIRLSDADRGELEEPAEIALAVAQRTRQPRELHRFPKA